MSLETIVHQVEIIERFASGSVTVEQTVSLNTNVLRISNMNIECEITGRVWIGMTDLTFMTGKSNSTMIKTG